MEKEAVRNVFIIGAKSIGQYGGYESFVDRLTEMHQGIPWLQYNIIVKANGEGSMDESLLRGVEPLNESSFLFRGARVFKVDIPNIGHAQAIAYDYKAWRFCLQYVRNNKTTDPIFYILGCRRWISFKGLVKKVHKLGGVVYINPDGHEWKRGKWPAFIRLYLKQCEKTMVRFADLIVCDSSNIEKYIAETYAVCKPRTKYIAYGAEIVPSALEDDAPRFTRWLTENDLLAQEYYLCCGRFVPENNFEIIIREFMKSSTKKPLVIISTENEHLLKMLRRKLKFENDPRIRFAGTVYDGELLKKIRENAFAGIHGHTVGGTNPSLLESLASTPINLVFDVCFNRETAGDAALYWSMETGSLSRLIGSAETMSPEQREDLEQRAKERIRSAYSLERISAQYEALFSKER